MYGNPGTANTGSMDTGKSVGSEENPGTVNTGCGDWEIHWICGNPGTANTGSMDTGKSTGSVETLEL